MPIRFDQPALLLLLVGIAPLLALGLRSLATLDRARRATALALRAVLLVLLVVLLAGPSMVRTHGDLTVMAVLDRSESVRRFAQAPSGPGAGVFDVQAWLAGYLERAAGDRRPDDRIGVVAYDGLQVVAAMPGPLVRAEGAARVAPVEGTDSGAALRLALAALPPDSAGRLVWASDGNDTRGAPAVLDAAREAAAAGVAIDVLPIDYRLQREVMVEALYAPSDLRQGQAAALRVVLRATQPTAGRILLLRDEVPVTGAAGGALDVAPEDWTLEARDAAAPDTGGGRYVLMRSVEVALPDSGVSRFEAIFEPFEPGVTPRSDTIAANNRAAAVTLVQGKGKLLLLDGVGGDSGTILPRVLGAHGVEVEVRPASGGVPANLTDLQRYDAVILHNVPAEHVTLAQQRLLARYVHDLAGGFVMIGGPDSFGAGGWTNSPVDDLLPVACEVPAHVVLPSGALVLVIDRSGSMEQMVGGSNLSQQQVASEAAVLALTTLYADDLIGVVAFDSTATWVVPLTRNDNPVATAKRVRSIQSGGGTDIYAGLTAALDALAPLTPQDAALRHVILLTDGQSEGGDSIALAQRMVRQGISISTVGIGDGQNSQLLANIAAMAGGQFYPVQDPNKLPQIFMKEARTVRRTLIREASFTPQSAGVGSPITADLPALPPLHGLVLTGAKSRLGNFTPLLGPEGEPLFAHGQVGLGRTAAFTSDATNRWARDWLVTPAFAEFWTRTLRHVARPGASADADLAAAPRGPRLAITLDTTGTELDPATTTARGSVLDPRGNVTPVTLTQTGPYSFETDLPAPDTGGYLVSLLLTDGQGRRVSAVTGASKPPGPELRRFTTDRTLLEQVATLTGGRVLDPLTPDAARLFHRDTVVETRSLRPLWRLLLPWVVGLFLLDVAARRIAWDPQALAEWARQQRALWRQSGRRRSAEAAATVGALRAARARRDAAGDASTAAPPPPPAVAGGKFEAAPGAAAADDFAAAVGAATQRDKAEVQPATPAADDASTTSRLLAAKRRARDQLDE